MYPTKYRNILLSVLAVVVLTIVPAVIHGSYSNRWGQPEEQVTAAAAIDTFPKQLGNWVAVGEAEPLSSRVQQELGLVGYVSRVYRNPRTQNIAQVLLMVGDAGPLVRHPPEICYGNRANELRGESEQHVPAAGDRAPSEFRVLNYEPNSTLAQPFRVAYAWSSDGGWKVPSLPRIAFGGKPVLYKVQIQVMDSELVGDDHQGELEELLGEFVDAFHTFVSST